MHDDLSYFDDQIQINIQSETVKSSEVFESGFGKLENMRVFGVCNSMTICDPLAQKLAKSGIFSQMAEIFFFTQLNMSLMKRGLCENSATEYSRHLSSPVYNELTWEFEKISM